MDIGVAKTQEYKQGMSLQEANDYIYSFDLTPVIRRLIDTECWSEKHARAAAEQYRNFLYLMKKYGREHQLTPSYEIDEAWHAHILHTKKYVAFCEKVFGKYLHHYPHLVQEGGDTESLNNRFKRTQLLHKEEFGDFIYQIKRQPIRLKQLFKKPAFK